MLHYFSGSRPRDFPRISARLARGFTVVLLALATRAHADATDTAPAPDVTPAADGEPAIHMSLQPDLSPDSIDQWLLDAQARPAGLLPYGPVSLIDPAWKQLNKSLDKVGLHLGLAYTALLQAASNGPGTRTAAGGDFDFFGEWRLFGDKTDPTVGLLYFSTEFRGDLGTGIAPAALGGQIGSLWGTTNAFGEQAFTVKELYWEQRFAVDRLIIRAGKIDPENFYNTNYWQSDNKYFVNQAFSSFPVRAFPGIGLGFNITGKINDQWYVTGGAQDAQGHKTTAGFNTLFGDGNLFSAVEVGYTPDIPQLGKGAYRATAWYRDAGDSYSSPHDAGFDLSFDQHITRNLIPFFRYGVGEGNIKGIQQMVSTGIGWEGKLLTPSDAVGIAGAWGQPSAEGARDQYAAELFYRMQVSPGNQFSLGYQVIYHPTNAPTTDVVGVFEVRWRITF